MKKSKGPKHEIKKAANNLEKVPFPQCVGLCKAIEWFGAGVCENICSFKFEEEVEEEK